MATAGGPNIKRDGLVFGYDTGEFPSSNSNRDKFKPGAKGSRRFFKGKPSINYAAHKNAVPQSTYTSYAATTSGTWVQKHPGSIRAFNAQGSDISWSSNSGVGDWTNTYHAYWTYDKELKKPVIQMNAFDNNWKAKSFGVGMGAWSSLGVSAGDKYVISWLQWTSHIDLRADVGFYSKNTSNGNGFHDGRQSPRNTKTHRWERVHAVYTVSSNRNLTDSYGSIYMYGHTTSNGAGKILKIANVQIEILTDHPTEYLDSKSSGSTTSRSSTQSLIDLTKSTDIDVSNVSFDSDGLPTFDGTDDHITGILPIDGNGTPHTIEMVFSSNVNQGSLGGRRDPFTIGNSTTHQYSSLDVNTGYMNWYFYSRDTTFTNSPLMVANKFYHIVLSYAGGASNNTNKKVWFNGVQQTLSAGSSETSLLPNNPSFSVGRDRGRNTAYWPGKIPVFKVYNRALTAKEAQQNFKAYKNRFNI